MQVIRTKTKKSFDTPEGIMTPVLLDEQIKLIHLSIPAGIEVAPHSHPGTGYILVNSGSITLEGMKTEILNAGDMAVIPGGCEVGLKCTAQTDAWLIGSPDGYQGIGELEEKLERLFGSGSEMKVNDS